MKSRIIISIIAGAALLVGASTAAYAKKTEFYYQTYGGFIEGAITPSVTPTGYIPGDDAQTQDGPWDREGPFSKLVQFGDQNEGNIKDERDQIYGYTTWPALGWGHPPEDPWVSDDPKKGGASGIGLIGYGYKHSKKKEGRKIVVGKDDVLYPMGAVQHHNYPINFGGSVDLEMSWNIDLYDKKGTLVHHGHYLFNLFFWETINVGRAPFKACPQTYFLTEGPMTDTAFNQMQHDIQANWPVTGLGDTYYADSFKDEKWCADAFGYEGSEGIDHFSVFDKKGKVKNYTIHFDGFWTYHPETKGCPPLDSGLYNVPKDDKDAAWRMRCFTESPTFWSQEAASNTGWVRLRITEDGTEEGCTCKEIKPIDSITMDWNGTDGTVVEFVDGTTVTVNKGDTISETGLEGRGNDIVWTLSGATTGTSVFHISCSDQDMNDESDIGKAEGNGKKNDSSLINDWIFVDMNGTGGSLTDCSAQPAGASCKDQKPIDKLALRWQGLSDTDNTTITKINVWFSEVGKGDPQVITDPVAKGELLTLTGLSVDNPKDIVLELFKDDNVKIGESMFHISCSEEDLNDPSDCGGTVGSGKNDNSDLVKRWTFEGMSGATGDPIEFCTPPAP